MEPASGQGVPISSLDSSGGVVFFQVEGVALVGATVGFLLALVDGWASNTAERLENAQRNGRRRRRRSAGYLGLLAGRNRLHEKGVTVWMDVQFSA